MERAGPEAILAEDNSKSPLLGYPMTDARRELCNLTLHYYIRFEMVQATRRRKYAGGRPAADWESFRTGLVLKLEKVPEDERSSHVRCIEVKAEAHKNTWAATKTAAVLVDIRNRGAAITVHNGQAKGDPTHRGGGP